MILKILSEIKLNSRAKIEEEAHKVLAISSIQKMLAEIDFESEIVQINDANKLINLLTSLKGKPLTKDEINIIEEILEKN